MRAAAEQAVRDNLDMLSRLVRLQAAVADADFSVDLLLDRLATMALEVTQAPGAEFELLDGPELVLRSSSGVAVRPVGMRRMPAQLSREAARHGRNLLCMDAQADPRVDAQWCLRYGVRSLAGTTIQLNGAAIGTLVVVSPEVAAFTDVHASVLQLLGEFLGGLLHRRHAQDEAEGHLLMLERAADAAQRVVAHTSLQDGLREAAAQLRRVIPASHCLISLVAHDAAPEAGQVTLRAYDPVGQDMALDSRAADAVALDINARETSAIARAVQQTGRPMRLDRAGLLAQTGSPDQHAGPGKQGNGWLGVPLVGRDGAKLGLAQLWDKESGEFSLRDEYVAIEMAQLISVAIENARLFEAIHELNQSLERKVVERSRELARQEAVFHTVADHAPQIMWIVDSKGAVTWLNRYWYELVGGEPPRWQGREWMQAVHPDDVAQMLERWVV
jgi:GAF domain-containing protein